MKRRGRGEGSIFQRTDGLWVGVLTTGYTETGKRRRRTLYGPTKAVVLERMAHLRHAALTGMLGEATKLTVGDYLRTWLSDAARPRIRDTTHASYEELIRIHIAPRVGSVALAKLTPAHVQHVLGEMKQAGLSAQRQRLAYRVLSAALKRAVQLGLVPRNVCHAVTCPKRLKMTPESFTPQEADAILRAAAGNRLEALYVLAITAGLREGELFGLQPDCIDFKTGRLFVKQQLCELGGRRWLNVPKTDKGRREIHLTELALTALREHRKRQLAAGFWRADGYVFADTSGGPLRRSNFIRREWQPLTELAGLVRAELVMDAKTKQPIIDEKTGKPKIRKIFPRFHATRHTAATLLLMQGVHPRVAQELLGHSSIAVTMDTYSHVLPSMGEEAAAKMDALFGNARAQKS